MCITLSMVSAQVMAKYNVVFQYLLRLKRIQVDLESSWAVMRRQAGRSRDLPLHTRRLPLWHLRHHMAYIIANLQIYVQVCLSCHFLAFAEPAIHSIS